MTGRLAAISGFQLVVLCDEDEGSCQHPFTSSLHASPCSSAYSVRTCCIQCAHILHTVCAHAAYSVRTCCIQCAHMLMVLLPAGPPPHTGGTHTAWTASTTPCCGSASSAQAATQLTPPRRTSSSCLCLPGCCQPGTRWWAALLG